MPGWEAARALPALLHPPRAHQCAPLPTGNTVWRHRDNAVITP
ncbi:MAG: hypothetical protein AVDCRST_MAG88-3447 [uncultured Thermomicrobiales bacterium]|uniref:Uncharacterized protein n=1 Tax=uncultured Thermomicrobiales bacterium TaxID=1645740 RepID=A0A6J4VLV6_9BACT|nr:MAG: hypothetical protein AVDCRST_MAG88-3447 [uncultured Thermomicrobiales bacterium]